MSWRFFFRQINIKNLSSCSWEITKKSFRGKLLKIFHFSTLWIWLFGIFDKHPQGCDEVKNSMGLLQGPRLMTWTTKSQIRGNHWVPLGCRTLLGSVKCEKCDYICFLKCILKIHVASVHESKKQFKCEISEYSCNQKCHKYPDHI